MILKLIGATFILAGCGRVGFSIAAAHRREEENLQQLIGILDYMQCELQYRLTPLPELCRQAAKLFSTPVGKVFSELCLEMESQVSPDLSECMLSIVERSKKLTPIVQEELLSLAKSLGRFDLDGQLKGFESVRHNCRRQLEILSYNRDTRLRSYQTLGLCTGAAFAILFV